MVERWSAEIVSRHGHSRGSLGTVRGGSLDWSIFRMVSGSGSLEVDLDPSLTIDWMSDRVRIKHHAEDGTETSWGTWMISAPSRQTTATGTSTTLGLLDGTETLNQPIGWIYSVRAGSSITGEIEDIFRRRSGWRWYSVEHLPATIPTALTPDPDMTWLQLANELARMIGHGSVTADREGYLRISPYVAPSERPTTATYGPGSLKMLGEWTDEMDLWGIKNIVRVVSEGTDERPPIVGMAHNYDPSDPTSVAGLGGRSQVRVEHAEVASKAEAVELAQRLLDEESRILRRATITHPVDATWIDDAVLHAPLEMVGNIVERRVSLEIGAVVEDTIRQQIRASEASWLAR